MKKNKFMRLASVLLVLTLLTTCGISGTFAKYVTSAQSGDSARVAKWGVVLTVGNAGDNSSFATSYKTDDSTSYKGELSVQVETNGTDKLVAPGTKSDGIEFTIAGKPEVATKVDIEMTVTNDIFLKKTSAAVYCPVVFTLTQGGTTIASGTLTDIEKAVETYASTAYYAPNTDLAATFKLTWAWAFEGTDDATTTEVDEKKVVDEMDTLLGDLAVNTVTGYTSSMPTVTDYTRTYTDNTYCTNINYTITFTVTQVD